jgi:hypothetical protein
LDAVPIVIFPATERANRHQNRGDLHGGRRRIGNRSRDRNWNNHDGAWRISMLPIITVPIVDLLDHPAGDVPGGCGQSRPWGGVAARA